MPLAAAEGLVERLVDAQLVEVAGRDGAGQLRYRLHDLLRLFARELLHANEPPAQAQLAVERLLDAHLALAQRAAALVDPGRLRTDTTDASHQAYQLDPPAVERVDRDPLSWLAAERANLVAAVEQAHTGGWWRHTWQLAVTLPALFDLQARWDDWKHTHHLAADAAQRLGDRRGLALVRNSLGVLYRDQSRWQEAITCLNACLRAFRELGDRRWQAHTLRTLGMVYRDQSRWQKAITRLQRALSIFRELGDDRWEAITRISLANTYRNQGRLPEAVACFEQSLPVLQAHHERRWEAIALRGLGDVYRDQHRPDQAIACFQQSLPVFRELGDRLWEGYTLRSLGEACLGGRCPLTAWARSAG
jgi:tetratricopeptide (TPR) repeat protein